MIRFATALSALGAAFLLSTPRPTNVQHDRVQDRVVRVPARPTPTIDGRLAPREWDRAATYRLTDGTELRLQHDAHYLYVALHGRRPLLGSLCIPRGDTIRVLHASMALGTAIYRRADTTWSLVQGFSFTMRETDTSAATRAKRAAFLTENGWIANTTPMGEPSVREYQIALSLLPSPPFRLSVASIFPQDAVMRTASWSRSARDDCAELELVRGNTPEHLHFQPTRWTSLVLEDDGLERRLGPRD